MEERPQESLAPESLEVRVRRLKFRSWHRGTREMDLLLGRFADAHADRFTADQVALYEALLLENDPDLYGWATGAQPLPPELDHDVMRLLRDHLA
jgi:antitoxin CptB